MTNNRIVCVSCSRRTGKVVRFHPERNGVFIPYGFDDIRHADLFKCDECGAEIVGGFGEPFTPEPEFLEKIQSSKDWILRGVVEGD